MERVQRFDAGTPVKVVRLDNGHLQCVGTLGKVGVLEYLNPDGTKRREFRPPEEVFAAESLASLALAPVTLGHPKTSGGRVSAGFVDDKTTAKHIVGVVGERLDQHDSVEIRGAVRLYDERGIKAIDSGTREISPGYDAQLDPTPGVYNGQPYDFVQRNIRYNHVAIVRAGRAGSSVRLHLDEADDFLEERQKNMVKVKIGGVDFEVPEQAAQAFSAEAERQEKAVQTATARADSLDAQLTQEKQKSAQRLDEDEVKKRVADRLKLERAARDILGTSVRLDELTDRAIQEQVITKSMPAMGDKLKDAADAYVATAFDIAVANYKPAPSNAIKQARADAEGNDGAAPRLDSAEIRKKFAEDQKNAWTKPLTGGVVRESN